MAVWQENLSRRFVIGCYFKRFPRTAKGEARAEIARLKEAIASFRGQVQGALSAIPEGVQASFPQELERVRQWLGLAVPRAASGINSRGLLGVVEQLRRLADEGKTCLSCVGR